MGPTTQKQFDKLTSLNLYLLIDDIVQYKLLAFSTEDIDWFTKHTENRIRYMHATNKRWKKWLENKLKSIDPRDQCKVWIRHWTEAFKKNPKIYKEIHTITDS